MFYRRKQYIVKQIFVENFNSHFNKTLLPTQLKYGSRLIGRWMTETDDDFVEIFAIWEYASYQEYEQIEENVRSDQEHVKRVLAWYESNGGRQHVSENYFISVKNEEIKDTVL